MLQATPHLPGTSQGGAVGRGIGSVVTPEVAAVATFLALMAGVMAAIMGLTGGYVGYSQDDPYIHIAMAERLRLGHYGINLGEITSPSSSVIWPFLLVPAARTAFGQYMPLLINTVLGVATAVLLGRFAATLPLPAQWRHGGAARVALASALVVACNLVGLAWTGLEHNLQVLVAAAVAIALIGYWRGQPLPQWALVLAALGPGVRYEMLAITAAVVMVLLLESRWRTLLMVGAASLVLPGLLSLFLLANGNYPLPNSVVAKLSAHTAQVIVAGGADAGAAVAALGVWDRVSLSLGRLWLAGVGGKLVMIGILAVLVWCWLPSTGKRRIVLSAALVAAALHMGFGHFGWFYRYELYAIAFCGLIAVAALAERSPRLVLPLSALASLAYLMPIVLTPGGAQNVYLQHYQMHRFVTEHWRKPFAVNDLGWVSVGTDPRTYVLDLWGLASNEAVRQRSKNATWLDDVTRRHDVGLAMVYPTWFPQVPVGWRKVAELSFQGPVVTIGGNVVHFYSTGERDRDALKDRLVEFAPSLPPGAALKLY